MNTNQTNQNEIVDYAPEYQPYFEKFNRQWIEELFEMTVQIFE